MCISHKYHCVEYQLYLLSAYIIYVSCEYLISPVYINDIMIV